MLLNNRIIWRDNTQLNDLSVGLSNYLTGNEVIALTAAQDAIYFGTDLPFNHRWFELSHGNASDSKVSISVWDSSSWFPVVDILDQTSVSGASLGQSGIISWVPDRLHVWSLAQSTEDISDLSSLKIYDMFWIKMSFSGDFDIATAIKYIGHKFANDEDLFSEYPGLSNTDLMNAYKAGKTNWNDQHFAAAEYIIQDMRAERVVWSENQVLDWAQFKPAAVHKCAEIIYRAFGSDYATELKGAQDAYRNSVKIKSLNLDRNANGRVDQAEKQSSVEFLGR